MMRLETAVRLFELRQRQLSIAEGITDLLKISNVDSKALEPLQLRYLKVERQIQEHLALQEDTP